MYILTSPRLLGVVITGTYLMGPCVSGVCLWVCTHACVWVCVYVCMCACVCACVYVRVGASVEQIQLFVLRWHNS